jgi:hypothetical protein
MRLCRCPDESASARPRSRGAGEVPDGAGRVVAVTAEPARLALDWIWVEAEGMRRADRPRRAEVGDDVATEGSVCVEVGRHA